MILFDGFNKVKARKCAPCYVDSIAHRALVVLAYLVAYNKFCRARLMTRDGSFPARAL